MDAGSEQDAEIDSKTTIDPHRGLDGGGMELDGAPVWPAWASARAGQPDVLGGTHVVSGHKFAFAFWDSRSIELVLVPGRVDPGGSGQLPPASWPRAIAAFNGGFRSVHGHYGLRAEGRTFLPARAGLATLALLGSSWTLGTLDDPAALADAIAFRQNLPPLYAHGTFDPTGRGTFGAVAPGKREGRTTRSALGLRADGGFVYIHGVDVLAVELAAAGREAGAAYVMALDMNDGQAGFEWLSFGPPAARDRGRPSAAAMTKIWNGAARGHEIQAERLSVPMGTPLPRWLFGDPRDHFVLLRSPSPLPPARLSAAAAP